MRDGHRLVMVEFTNDMLPFSVVTMDANGHYDHYDFEFCRRDGCFYFSKSGNSLYLEGADSPYWLSPRVAEELLSGGGEKPRGKRLKQLPRRFAGGRLFDESLESEAIYCGQCKDFIPTEENIDLCEHVFWCDKHGWWGGVDVPDGCGCATE